MPLSIWQASPLFELLPGLLMDILTSLSFPKTMRWADYEFRFVRPIRWMVALFGDQIIPVEICGVKSGKFSMGHRFMQQSLKAAAESQGLLSAALSKVGNKVYSALAGVKALWKFLRPEITKKLCTTILLWLTRMNAVR